MKYLRTSIAVLLLLTQTVLAAGIPTDIATSFYRDAIQDLVQRKIVEGYPDGTFKPKQKVNRAELVAILMRSRGGITDARRRCFADVPLRTWYADVACNAKAQGIVSGERGGFFHPERTVNYAEALKIILKALDIPVDAPQNKEAWFEPYLDSAHKHGVISRYSFLPWQDVTRERMADIIKRALDYKDHPELGRDTTRLSPGCATSAPATPPSHIEVNGVPRDFILYVPQGYTPDAPRRIVFAFHGRTNSNAELRGYLEMEKYGGDSIVVYPAALPVGNDTYNWADAGDTRDHLRDFAFFDALLTSIGDQYCIDLNEVYVVGYSLGGWFANAVACARAGIVRGVASLGGSSPGLTCDAPVATMLMHNPHDNLSPISAGEAARDVFLEANACDGKPPAPVESGVLNCVRYSCAGAPVMWCPHNQDHAWWDNSYYPHVWPRGTAEHIFRFFDNLPR